MPEYIKTVGDIRNALQKYGDDMLVEVFLNAVETVAHFEFSGEGAEVILVVDPNYTCLPSPERALPGSPEASQ